MVKIRKIFITGGTGKIGRKIVSSLSGRGYQLTILSRKLCKPTKNIRYIKGDLTKMDFKIPKTDLIIHAAGVTGMFDKNCFKINYLGTINLLNNISSNSTIRLIFFSSIDAYGMTGIKQVSETGDEHPSFIYGKSKLLAEKAIEEYSQKNSFFKYITLRIGNVETVSGKEFSQNIDKFFRNPIIRQLMSGYEYNVIKIEKVVNEIHRLIVKNLFENTTYYLVGDSLSISKKYNINENRVAMFVAWLIFKIMSFFGKGGNLVYLSYGGLNQPYRRFK